MGDMARSGQNDGRQLPGRSGSPPVRTRQATAGTTLSDLGPIGIRTRAEYSEADQMATSDEAERSNSMPWRCRVSVGNPVELVSSAARAQPSTAGSPLH